ncbi:LPS assembly lipoprotein LptE [Campylobacter gastrosuis]|uniref:LPS assembly lipoprotein LptE n=1 Tax=Campylobacter gastrosuis TaxID=2974576 RepID=A0ABT7HNG6_9BACT|nr:LPS assembly lipoprotein LptE [Campylobacter gastrosuis]MDL0087953.1 LPS assembly lipoprotein LptE [Campylobacter gastrosuis]
MRYIFAIFLAFFFVGCGYKPVSKITNDVLSDSVYVEVIVDKTEPKNSVFIQDAVKEGIVSRLNRNLGSKESAKTKIQVRTKSLTYTPTIYDEYGYISSYQAVLKLEFTTDFKDATTSVITASGEYDFSISRRTKSTRFADSVISENEKYEAIREASKEAFDEYISKLAIKGYKNGSN